MTQHRDIEAERRKAQKKLLDWLDGLASKYHGCASIMDVPAGALDINAYDREMTYTLKGYILAPLHWATEYAEKNPDAVEVAAALHGPQHAQRKLARTVRRYIKTMLSVWKRDVLPWLMSAREAAQEERQDKAAPTVRQLAEDGRLRINSSWSSYQLGSVIANKAFQQSDDVPWPTAILDAGRAELIPTEAKETWLGWPQDNLTAAIANMNRRLDTFSQRTRDIYQLMQHRWLQHRSQGKAGNPWIGVDEILDALGYQKKLDDDAKQSRWGFAQEERRKVREAIENLAHIDVHWEFDIYKNGRKTKQPYSGRYLMLGDRRGQAELGGAEVAFTHIEFDLPALVSHASMQDVPYLYINIKALQYTEKKAAEKNLANYVAQLARMNPRPVQRIKVDRLLGEVFGADLKKPQAAKIRHRLERALQTIADDGILTDWKYANSDWDVATRQAWEAGKKPRGWLEEWLQQVIEMHIPDNYQTIRANREKLHKAAPAAPPADTFALSNDDTLVADIRKAVQGITKGAAAAGMGISRPTLNALLEGKAVQESVRQKASAWLNRLKAR